MSDIDFQNGFLCGMATKGLARSGELYQPRIWNDSGIYSYFYIDFGRVVQDFSTGMFNESIVIHDSSQLLATEVTRVNPTTFKIYCDISGRISGVTVVNKATSWLVFNTGAKVPVFSTFFWIAGLPPAKRLYCYDKGDVVFEGPSSINEGPITLTLAPEITLAISENDSLDWSTNIAAYINVIGDVNEVVSAVLNTP